MIFFGPFLSTTTTMSDALEELDEYPEFLTFSEVKVKYPVTLEFNGVPYEERMEYLTFCGSWDFSNDSAYIQKSYLIDPFAEDNSIYYYQSIYNRINGLREGFVLLSRGIDGKIDNFFSKSDTLFYSEINHLKLYSLDISKTGYTRFLSRDTSLFDKKMMESGGKDILVAATFNLRSMRERNETIISIDTITNEFTVYDYSLCKSVNLKGRIKKITFSKNRQVIYMENMHGLTFKFLIYPGYEISLAEDDIVVIAGNKRCDLSDWANIESLEGLKFEDTLMLHNCIPQLISK